MVPRSLRRWFVVHFAADVLFAVPLFLAPVEVLTLLGWRSVDPIATRLVAAALFGIGIESLLGRNAGPEAFRGMLNLKIIWSSAAGIGVAWSIIEAHDGAPIFAWVVLATFAAFLTLWSFYRVNLRTLDDASAIACERPSSAK